MHARVALDWGASFVLPLWICFRDRPVAGTYASVARC
jgi:hypothetical protein